MPPKIQAKQPTYLKEKYISILADTDISVYTEIMTVLNEKADKTLPAIPLLPLERTLELILEAVSNLVEYELAVVLSLDSEDALTVRKAAGPLANNNLENYTITLRDRHDLARIMDKGEPYVFAADEEHIDAYENIVDLPSGHSCLVAPLVIENTRIGLLTLDHHICGLFTPNIVKFIRSIARLIALNLAQADLNHQLAGEKTDLIRERNALLPSSTVPLAGMLGKSAAWLKALEHIRLVAATNLPVLVQGETGTGKELAARSVHQLSERKDKPFIALNCSALAPSLAESELFGHEKGAFTGAAGVRRGRFELANGGTLFLDEIGDLPIELQPKLLRVLQEGRLERLGSERTLSVDVRIIAATNVDLLQAVAEGRFREDLLYRLNVFTVQLPPLRERTDDIALLAEHFIHETAGFMAPRHGRGITYSLDQAALQVLESRHWPGNVRELRNAIERACILATDGRIRAEHVYPPYLDTADKSTRSCNDPTPLSPARSTEQQTLEAIQRQAILEALEACSGRIYGSGGAAARLGLKPSTLQSRMKKAGISLQRKPAENS